MEVVIKPGDTVRLTQGRKFWQISCANTTNTVKYGLITNTQDSHVTEGTTDFPTVKQALARATELIKGKVAKGYVKEKGDERFATIQAMLHSVGLGRYALNLETEGLTASMLMELDEEELKKRNLPGEAVETIMESKAQGKWVPARPGVKRGRDDDEIVDPPKRRIPLNPHEGIPLTQGEIDRFQVEQGKAKHPPANINVLLAETWSDDVDPTGWWMSEKLDGVRCYWNGHQFLSRNGNQFIAPKYFTENLPKTVSLDGELWMGRGMFQRCVAVVRKKTIVDPEAWKNIIYVLFDAPSINKPFEDRMKYLMCLAKTVGTPYMRAHEHYLCKGKEHVKEELEKVEGLGGEGLMLREPGSFYENRRSTSLLKVKTFQDAEATVIGYEEGEGRNQGRMGALVVRRDDGVQFKVGGGFTDALRNHPPKIGVKITYKFQELSEEGKPRFPIFLRQHPGM